MYVCMYVYMYVCIGKLYFIHLMGAAAARDGMGWEKSSLRSIDFVNKWLVLKRTVFGVEEKLGKDILRRGVSLPTSLPRCRRQQQGLLQGLQLQRPLAAFGGAQHEPFQLALQFLLQALRLLLRGLWRRQRPKLYRCSRHDETVNTNDVSHYMQLTYIHPTANQKAVFWTFSQSKGSNKNNKIEITHTLLTMAFLVT